MNASLFQCVDETSSAVCVCCSATTHWNTYKLQFTCTMRKYKASYLTVQYTQHTERDSHSTHVFLHYVIHSRHCEDSKDTVCFTSCNSPNQKFFMLSCMCLIDFGLLVFLSLWHFEGVTYNIYIAWMMRLISVCVWFYLVLILCHQI